MGNLSTARVTPSFLFKDLRVDYAGSIQVRLTKTREKGTIKGWICIFVCLSTRVIHLELVKVCTIASFIATFYRFIARRGW